jgi:hypothetical protein
MLTQTLHHAYVLGCFTASGSTSDCLTMRANHVAPTVEPNRSCGAGR